MKVYVIMAASTVHHMKFDPINAYSTRELADWAVQANEKMGIYCYVQELEVDMKFSTPDVEEMVDKYNIVVPRELIGA